jgi:arginase family enzyme
LEGAIPIILGGDHLSTLYAAAGAASVFSDLSVLQFDAHHDAYQELPLTHYSFVNVLRRRLPVTQVGVRFEAEKTAHPPVIRAAPTYLSLDVDYFSPELVRSVGHQVPGEIPGRPCAKDFQAALDEVSGPLVALDVCEWFGSQVDSEISELRAALTAFLGRVHGID